MEEVKLLEWDTDFFGYKVGKLDGIQNIDNINKDYRLIYINSSSLIDNLESNLYDKKATFLCKINQHEVTTELSKDLHIISFNKDLHDYNRLLELTLESGVYSRFLIDKNFINDEYRRLYSRWIENSVNKNNAIDVFIAIEGNNILGFATLTEKSNGLADIGLLAVAHEARGKKVATSLINFVKSSALELGFKELQVVTQLDNIPAVKLYESSGFKLNELIYIYHIWNHDTI